MGSPIKGLLPVGSIISTKIGTSAKKFNDKVKEEKEKLKNASFYELAERQQRLNNTAVKLRSNLLSYGSMLPGLFGVPMAIAGANEAARKGDYIGAAGYAFGPLMWMGMRTPRINKESPINTRMQSIENEIANSKRLAQQAKDFWELATKKPERVIPNIKAGPKLTEFEKNGKYTLDELHQMGYKLPRKHLQGENAVQMFKEYGTIEIPENSQIIEQLRKYVPEARERYGLVGNTNITDDEIAGSLYKKAIELGGNTSAVNEFGEPLVLFRGDTKRFSALRKVLEPESLAKGTGSMDNSFGNLFLGQLDGPGEGVERYIHYVYQHPSGATTVYPAATGERIIWNGNKIREQGAKIFIPEKYLSYDISKPINRYGQQLRRRKISSDLTKPNSNDVNAFVVRTPAIRNSSSEISPEMGGEFINVNGVPKFKNSSYIDREQAALRIRQILDDAKLKHQGLLKSDAYSPLRENEHFGYDYYALPNFNIRGAKHLLPFDLRIPTQWNSRIIYRKQGGILK